METEDEGQEFSGINTLGHNDEKKTRIIEERETNKGKEVQDQMITMSKQGQRGT